MIRRPPRSTLFPYTRSSDLRRAGLLRPQMPGPDRHPQGDLAQAHRQRGLQPAQRAHPCVDGRDRRPGRDAGGRAGADARGLQRGRRPGGRAGPDGRAAAGGRRPGRRAQDLDAAGRRGWPAAGGGSPGRRGGGDRPPRRAGAAPPGDRLRLREAPGPDAQGELSPEPPALAIDPTEREPPRAWSDAVAPEPEPPSKVVVPAPLPPASPGSPLVAVVAVGSVGGSVVLVLVVVLVVVVVGGAVVGGTVLVGGLRRRGRVEAGAWVVELDVPLVRGTVTGLRERVVGGEVEVADETCWRWGSVAVVVEAVVVVVCWVASAACLGEVARPTRLPPIAPISIAVTTLTHRRVATNATGLKRRTPPVRVPCP